MKTLLLSLLFVIITFHFTMAQNNPPVAVDDTTLAVAQVPLLIDVLLNDTDPDGDSLFIISVNAFGKQAHIEDGMIWFKPDYYSGEQYFRYTISDGQSSSTAHSYVFVTINPDAPVTVPDTFDLMEMIPETLDLLSNDSDPNGDLVKISEISQISGCSVTVNADSLSVTVRPAYTNYCSFNYQTREIGSDSLLSQTARVLIYVADNPDRPVAVADTAFTTGGISIDIPVINNDYDPQGEAIELYYTGEVEHGTIERIGNVIRYTPYLFYAGTDRTYYSMREVNDTIIYSEPVWIEIVVNQNPHCPVGLPDTVSGISAVPMIIDVIGNDYDPDGDPIELTNVTYPGILTPDNKIQYKSRSFQTGYDSIYYYVKEVNNPQSLSQIVKVMIYLEPNPAYPWAVNDTVTTYAGFEVRIDPLINDINNGFDSLVLYNVSVSQLEQAQSFIETTGNSVYYTPSYQSEGIHKFFYYVTPADSGINYAGRGYVVINVLKLNFSDSLTINNINAGVNANGDLFSDSFLVPGEQLEGNYRPHFLSPVGQQTGTIFLNRFFLGGFDNEDALHTSGNTYDWQQGPISNNRDSLYYLRYSRVWKLTREEVEYHKQNYQTPNYQPSEGIASWPGNGFWTSGEALHLAPFYDVNADDNYVPEQGDYPLIRGDECIFFICNDDMVRTDDTTGLPMKVELHGMVYGYDEPADTALFNTVFVHYDIINRTEHTYSNCFAGVWNDFDIGYGSDDFYKTDVQRSSYIGYNSLDIDGNGESWAYGDNPPAQSITVLAGPFIDPDGNDNPTGGCDESINGLNFGNDIIDDERHGLSRATEFSLYDNNWWGNDPFTYMEMYNFMNGIWDDETPILYGGNGHQTTGATGPEARYMFPGNSDPMNYGTDCQFPANGYNQGTKFWTEEQTRNQGGDRRGLGSMGPFTLAPGQVQEIEMAYCTGFGNNGAVSSVNQLLRNIDSLRNAVAQGKVIVPNASLGIRDSGKPSAVNIYPNPATDVIAISNMPVSGKAEYSIFNLYGTKVLSGNLTGERPTIKTGNLTPGMYVLRVSDGKNVSTGKFVKL